jgi:hypothetical protein
MPSHFAQGLVVWIIGAIFGAGGAWAVFQRMRKDVNGIGAVQRRDRWNSMLATMVVTEEREDRQRWADLMRQQ